jgi:hypothetical protein
MLLCRGQSDSILNGHDEEEEFEGENDDWEEDTDEIGDEDDES